MEDYEQKARNIFKLINKFRTNPNLLINHLEQIKQYLDIPSKILSEPNKVQIQMVEGIEAFNEAINFLKKIKSLEPLKWDENLAKSAKEHVEDIGPKGLLQYTSSDGTEPEDRICKYGNYIENLGENIDFGPNDEMGVIVSLTLDDGEENRPHRENLFITDFKKIGIACGPHQTEFQMCVMDFAFDFIPLSNNNPIVNLNLEGNHFDEQNRSLQNINELNLSHEPNNNRNNNQSPFVKLSLENDDIKNYKEMMKNNNIGNNNIDNEINQMKNINQNLKVIKKIVEITKKIIYTYDDGTTKEITEKTTHTFN